jgi:hypothetical protein
MWPFAQCTSVPYGYDLGALGTYPCLGAGTRLVPDLLDLCSTALDLP